MKQTKNYSISQIALRIFAVLLLTIVPSVAFAQGATNPQLAKRVRHELVTLPYYGVFDNLAYSVSGSTVVLRGQVVRPTLKTEAQARVREIEGVDHVDNQIEVLPVSPFDDDIRRRAYRTIFSHPQMTKYGIQPVPPVHIIVKNGNLSLEGVVANEADKNVAGILANQVPNVFSVRNHLRISRD